jgi:hypothetical protein
MQSSEENKRQTAKSGCGENANDNTISPETGFSSSDDGSQPSAFADGLFFSLL